MIASFEQAFKKTSAHEGGYSDDPDDYGNRGGNITYRGISQRHFPEWVGWPIVFDAIKHGNCEPAVDLLVKRFYKSHFWEPFNGDDLPQELANELFDTSVNMHHRTAVRFLQRALNVLNRNHTLYPDLKIDGRAGARTHEAVRIINEEDDLPCLLKIMNALQANHYISIVEANPVQGKFIRGWLNRV